MTPDEEWSKGTSAHVKQGPPIPPEQVLTIEAANLVRADYSGRKLRSFAVVESTLTDCNLERMVVDAVDLAGGSGESRYQRCSFDGSRFKDVGTGFGRLESCTFRSVSIGEWQSDKVELIDCVFSGRIRRAVFWGKPRSPEESLEIDAYSREQLGLPPQTEEFRSLMRRPRNQFWGNDFSGTDLVDVAFRGGIDLSQQLLPDGPDYVYLPNAANAIATARDVAGAWHDTERRAGLTILDMLSREVGTGQAQLLIRRSWYRSAKFEAVRDRLFDVLLANSNS